MTDKLIQRTPQQWYDFMVNCGITAQDLSIPRTLWFGTREEWLEIEKLYGINRPLAERVYYG